MTIQLSKAGWLMVTCVTLLGCSFEKIGHDAGTGVAKVLPAAVDTAGRSLVNAVRTELTKDESRKDIQHFIDSLLAPVSQFVRNTAGSTRDSFINKQTRLWVDSLLETVTGDHLRQNLLLLQTSLVDKTKKDIYDIEHSVEQLLYNALGDTTRIKLGLIRDELLGPKTGNAINRLIDTAVTHIVDSSLARFSMTLRSEINPMVKEDITFVRRNAILLLTSLAVLAAIIITLVWLNRKKYLRMVAMLTKQIHDIPDQQVYDKVTAKIKNEAVTSGLEPTLRKVLIENGLLGSDAWKKTAPTS